MKLKILPAIIIGLLFASCKYDYDFGGEFIPKVVVSSTITPDSTIKVYLHWSKHISDKSNYKVIERFTAQIYEDGVPILEGEEVNGVNGILSIARSPKEGSEYRLEINVPDYGELSAETSIPIAPHIALEYVRATGGAYGEAFSYHHFSVTKIEFNTPSRSAMIRSVGLYKKGDSKFAGSYNINNSFCDQFNAANDSYQAGLKGSNVSHWGYLRVPSKNIEYAIPLNFSIYHFNSYSERITIGEDDFGFPIYKYKEHQCSDIKIEVIAPSDDYDRFHKSAYMQHNLDYLGDQMPIFSETLPVYTNIENGLGCFMGYTYASETYEIKYDE